MKEDTCQSTNGDVKTVDTNSSNSKTTLPSEQTRSSAPSAEPSQSEPSTQEPASVCLVEDGPVPTSGKLLAVPTDNKQTRWEKFKHLLSSHKVRPNQLLLNPEAKVLWTFTVWVNGHIQEGVAITNDPNARAFQVLAVQLTRQSFHASAQPIDKRKPSWWAPGYANLVMQYMESTRQMFMKLNEREMDATGNNLRMISQPPQQGVKK